MVHSINIKSLLSDARHFQILYLSVFLIYGIQVLEWEVGIEKVIIVLGSTLLTQFLWLKITGHNLQGLKSGLITGLGLCLLLNSMSLFTLGLAGVLAISSKFMIRIRGKHLFNPANFGIVISILVFKDAWISPGQWGSDALFFFVLSVLGGVVLKKIGRLETTLVFLGVLLCLEFSRTVLYQGWGIDVLMHKFSSGTLLLFAFFMITDPMTIPNAKRSRMIWASILALLTFILSNWVQLYTAPIWVLFAMTPITIYLDKIYPSLKFEWKTQEKSTPLNFKHHEK